MIIINPDTRQFNIPGAELVFGVESDAGSERKYFQCPRYVGNNLDLASCFVRMNFRNANGAMDSYLVDDVTVDGDNVTFSWVLSEKAVKYKGHVKFVVCVVGPNQKVEWHTTLGTGMVLEGLEPDTGMVESETADVVAQLIAMVEAQTQAVKAEGATQIKAVQTAAKTAEAASVAEIEAKGVNALASIPDDYTALSAAVDGLTRGRAGAIVCEAAGSAVAVNDASDNYIQGLRIFGRSTQDGTPTPDAPVEIVSVEKPKVTVGGKNLLDVAETHTFTGHEAIAVKIPPGQYMVSNKSAIAGGEALPYIRFGKNKCGVNIGISGGEKIVTLSVPETTIYLYSSGYSDSLSKDVTSTVEQLMVSVAGGSYAPYTFVQTVELTNTLPGIPVTSGGNYTDSDGQQWICDEVDLERGVYVQRVGEKVFDGTEVFAKTNSGDVSQYQHHIDGIAKACGLSTHYVVYDHYSSALTKPFMRTTTSNVWFEYTVGTIDTITDLQAFLAEQYESGEPVAVAYQLATPIETPLSETEIAAYRALHSNYPNTTVLNDAGAHMVVKYAADTKLYIDNKIAALAAKA